MASFRRFPTSTALASRILLVCCLIVLISAAMTGGVRSVSKSLILIPSFLYFIGIIWDKPDNRDKRFITLKAKSKMRI
ncbi:hypothetical protein UNSWDHB_2682 [Dehalobacter sp. UNSWDHB]|nr:hypothetical protein UNSWDHB_2682 [Dehalobacter sp. UNSWDHB]